MIVDCVDKLLATWRTSASHKVHLGTVQQCQNLLLAVFGFIAFDFDLETLDDGVVASHSELADAIRVVLTVVETVLHLPNVLGNIYLKISSKYKQAQATIERYSNRIIDHELEQSLDAIAQHKRTSFITSLVSSLQQDEKAEAMKSEEQKKGEPVPVKYRICKKKRNYPG